MKKFFKPIFLGLAALTVLIIAGCASAATLMSRGDNVGAIEKLASTLTKKPNDQESADLFVSLYPSEVENRIQYTERNVPDIINDWVRSQGQSSLTSALRARKQAIGSNTFLADDGEIRSLINEMEITHKNLKDLEKIQRAVVKMPNEIGDVEVYFVEKYSDNFSGMAQIADRSMAEFYYELANAAAPGVNRSQKKAVFDLYDKVNLYSTGYANISAKRAEAAYALAEDYLSGSTIDEKKEAISWFNRANNIVTNYNDTNTRIREANYQIGLLYILKWADADLNNANTIISNEYQIRSDMNNAIKYLEESRGYKDASTHIANCRKVLAALDALHAEPTSRAADSGTGTSNTGTSNTGTTNTNTGTNNSSSGNATTPAVTAKASVLVPDSAKFSLGSNNKINAAVSVVTQGDVSLSKDRITLVTNTAGATVKSITVLKSIDSSFTKYKTRDTSAKTASYTINFELEKAGQFIFRILDAKGGKVDLVTANGKSDTISPSYTLSTTEYNKLIPAKEPTPSTPSTPTVTAPVVLVDSNAKYSVVNKKVNATVNIAVEGDLSVTASNIKFDANTAGATVKSVAPTKAVDTSLTKIQTPVKTKGETTKVTGYTITFELSKAGQIVFRVLDAKGGKVQHNATNGNKDTCSPLYTLTEAEYNKLIPPAQTTPSNPVVAKPTLVVDSTPKFSVVNGKVNATVNTVLLGDLSLTKDNIKLSTNTAGATVKSVSVQKAIDTALSKAPSLNTKQKTAQKTTPYQITFELTKAGNFSFNVVDSTTVKNPGQVSIVTLEGKTGTVSPTYTLTDAKYKELIPPAVTPTPTPVATKPTMVVDSAPKYSVVSNKVNAALNVIVVGDLALTKDNIKLSTNTAGATVKSVTAQKAVDATLSKSKPLASLKATAKTTGYVITFELAKAGNYSFGVIPSTTAKSATQIEIASIDGKTGTVSPTYTLTEAEYNKLIPPAVTPTPTPVAKPSVLVSNTANYSVVSSKVNATVNIVVLGDLSLTKDNIKLSTNTAGATVKSIGAQNSIDAALSKAPSLNTKQKTAQKTTPYQITFELTKAGNFSFNVVDSTTVKNPGQVSIVTLDGKTGTVSPTYTLTEAEYNKIVPKPSAIIYKEGSYSTTAAEYIIPFTLENYSSPISMNEINVTKNTTGGTVTVSGTASNAQLIIRNITKSGTFFFTYKDRNTGNVMPRSKAQGGTAITEYTIDINKVWTKPSLQFFKKSSSHYPTYEPVVRFPFEVTGLTYYLSKNNINVASNVCGAVWNLEHDNVSSLGRNTAVKYYIVLSDIKKSGDFTYSVLDNAGKVMTSTTNKTSDTFTVDIDKVFAQSVMYNDSIFFSKTGEANTNFNVYGMSTDRQVKHIKIVTNTTGATVKSVTRSDNGRLSYMRVYDIVFTGIKNDGVISFYVLDDAGKNLAVVHSVNGDEISAPTRNPTTNDIVKYNVKVQNIKSAHQLVYGSAPGYSTEKGQVTIPFTLKPSGTAPAFTASNVVVLTNGTGGTVSSVKSLGTNSYIVVLDNVTKSGSFQYRLKDANGYTITPEGFKNSGGATHSSAASPTYSIDHSKVADGTSNLRVTYDTGVTYPTTLGTAKVTFTVSDPAAATVSKTVSKTSPKDLTSITPPTAGAPIAGIAAATPTTLKMSNVQVLTNGTGGTPSLTHLGSGKYEIVLSNVTKSGTFQFQLKDNGGRLIVHPNFTGTPNTILSPAYSININSVAAGKVKTADKVVYASENNNVVVQVPLTAEGGIVLKQSDFALVTNTCGAKIIRLDRTGTTAKYTLVLSVTKAGKFSFSVTSGSTTPTVYCDADAKYMKKAATKNVSVEFEVSVANGGTLQQKLELLEQVDPFKPATMLDLNSMLQKGTSVNGALQLKDNSGTVYTLKNSTASKDMQKVQERIESDGVLKADALKDKVKR